ncbi:histidine phosphatase family protein [Secundilactobacillus folii]|uniref:histidine phosphatase family protein n=1 Tax=Secundilactobacillus folii TaxID=2678357 RepID=UPI001FE813C0|nr:histidine phosphatase family protein [Secundilactobacillus folii]
MANFDLYFVRHGQTVLNKYHRVQGIIDSPLTAKGVKDAKEAGARLAAIPFTKAYASNTQRAQDTAKYILAANSGIAKSATISPAFHEENFGYLEGNDDVQAWHMIGSPDGYDSFNAMINAYTIEGLKDRIAAFDPFGDAEDNATFWARVQTGFDELKRVCRDGDKVLIASHGTTIRSIVSRFAPDIDIAKTALNGAVTKLHVADDKISVVYYNRLEGPFA